MTGWLKLTDDQRRETLTQAAARTGIGVKALEKDWWVTLVLKALFQSAYAQHLLFKGGTSLSKGWKLINRLSEDIDLALDPVAFGMEYKEGPGSKYVTKLKREGCAFTSNQLLQELSAQLTALGVPEGMLTIEAKPVPPDFPDTDPQTIYVKYPPLYDPNPYIADDVKIEVSVRSLKIPFTVRPILSILSEAFPNPAYAETPFEVTIVEPRKTFLEKTFLLHEEFGKPDKTKIRYQRMSRHYYDLAMNMDSGVADEALADHGLYDHLIIHRQGYSRISWVNYDSLGHASLAILPPDELLEHYRNDYAAMREVMIYGEPPSFDELMDKMKFLQGRFRIKMEGRSLSEIVEKALAVAKETEGDDITVTVIYELNPESAESPTNSNRQYSVRFKRHQGTLSFESITIL